MNSLKLKIRETLVFFYRILDVLALIFALWTAFVHGSPQGAEYIVNAIFAPKLESTLFFAGVLLSWSLALSSMWLYQSKRLATWQDELLDAVKAVGFCTLILAAMILVAEWSIFPKRFLLIFAGTSLLLFGFIRLYKRAILRQLRLNGRNLRSVIVVGAGKRGQEIAKTVKDKTEIGYNFLGFVDDIEAENILGKIDEIPDILVKNVVDEIVICLPIKTFYEKMENIAKAAEMQGITVRVYSDLFNLRLARAVPGQLSETPVLSLYTGPLLSGKRMRIKSVFDFVTALILVIIFSPLMLLIALLIRLTSKGPAMFMQDRVGLNKRPFKMFKFRTMVTDAEALQANLESQNEAGGPVFKIKDDPRVTKIGRFLRKTSLDELPQLFNVLLGDLSLVGPRPLPLRDVQKFDEYWFNRRFSIKPGITCIWQISGRSETSFDKWILQDLEYIDKWSLALDMKILLKTPKAVIAGTGAM
ncbi:MAG: sugar transferase [Pyrinomonadaceae bacterium]|nr:sugar transferase [Pyrinomonadaceae bacterium]